MYFSAFETNGSSAMVTSHTHRSSGSTDARLDAYQRELEGKSKTFSGYPPSHARGLNGASANRRSAAATFAPNLTASAAAVNDNRSHRGSVPPPPPPPPMQGGGLPHAQPHGQQAAFYQTQAHVGGHPQAAATMQAQAASQQQMMFPSHAQQAHSHMGYVQRANAYDQFSHAMLAPNPRQTVAAALPQAHAWGPAAGGGPAPAGHAMMAPSYVVRPQPVSVAAAQQQQSFIVLNDENTRPPHTFAPVASGGPSMDDVSSMSVPHPMAQQQSASVVPQLGPYTRPLPMNPKQVAAKSILHSQSMPVPLTDENNTFNGNYAQPSTQTHASSVLTDSHAGMRLESSDASMHQANSSAAQVHADTSMVSKSECERGVLRELSVLDEQAAAAKQGSTSSSMTDEEAGADGEAAAKMEVERPRVIVPPVKEKRPADGRTRSKEKMANDCDMFFDSDEILASMREQEMEFAPLILKDYMSVQKSLNNRMRLIVIDWLFEVEQEYNLDDRTMFLAVSYLDRFLSQVHLRRDQLQLVGTTCLYLASKFQEIDPPSAAQYTFIADKTFSIGQLFQMETCILDVLSFRLCVTTSYDFLLTFLMKLGMSGKAENFSLYLLSLFVESTNYGRFLPSQEAAAAIYLAKLNICGDGSWTAEHAGVTGYSLDDLKEIVKLYDSMHRIQYEHFVKHFLFDRGAPGHAVSDKFATAHKGEVSKVVAPLNYGGPRVTQPCDPRKLRDGTIRCR